ncbi:MAG: dicarboxylate/amino acid:cation symporter [bacterium]
MSNRETLFIFIGLIAGILVGIFLPSFGKALKILGDIYLNLLKMLVVPLVFVAVTFSIINLRDTTKLKKIGSMTIFLYFFTMFISIFVGMIIFMFIGSNFISKIDVEKFLSQSTVNLTTKSFYDFIVGIFPSNIFKSMVEMNMIQIIFFSVFLAFAVMKVNRNIDKVVEFFDYLFEVIMKMVKWVIALTPFGVFGLIANIVSSTGIETFANLYGYVISVVGGIVTQGLIILPLLIFLFTGHNGYGLIRNVIRPLVIGFTTCSSSATMPVTIGSCVENARIKKEVVDFVIPLGTTVNMNGTALYEAVAAMFVASVFGVDLGFWDYFKISLTSVFAAVGAAAVPGAGLVTMSIVFSSVGIPLEGIALIIVVDRFLDMFRTVLNIWGDIVVAFIVDKKIKDN